MPKTEHLAPYAWQPGQSGNPGGRPKKLAVSDILREQMNQPLPQGMILAMKEGPRALFLEIYGDAPTFAQMLAFKLITTSAKGDIFAFKELLDRVEGKVVQKQEHSGEVGIKRIMVPDRITPPTSEEPKPEFS